MNFGSLQLNPGAQRDFVLGDEKFSAFIGGLGSGKTYAGILRGLKFALQPKPHGVFHSPHGLIAAVSYPSLRDVIIPKLEMICGVTGVADWERDWRRGDMNLTLKNGAIIRLRSLDKPDNIVRGPEYSWAFIDEGRNVTLESWKLVTARLRQPGYRRAGWVASTPNGFDWMHRVFHEDGDLHAVEYPDAVWYGAAMRENIHLDEDYLAEMEVSYSGRWYEQEVLGRFLGMVAGGVFPEWDPTRFCTDVAYDKTLPLYTGWDFGIGDPGVCLFLQMEHVPFEAAPGKTVFLPSARIIDVLEAKDLTSRDWAEMFRAHLNDFYPVGTITRNYGDPAGMQRRVGVQTSVIEDLRAAGVPIIPAPRRSPDHAIRVLSNMMAGGRVVVDKTRAQRVSNALASHKWHLDKDGLRIGTTPVHDWTSHIVDALRYVISTVPMQPREGIEPEKEQPGQMTYGHVFKQLIEKPPRGGPVPVRPTFVPPTIGVRGVS